MNNLIHVLLVSICLLGLSLGSASGQQANNWTEAKSLSAETGKPILINFKFQACLPCRELYSNVFQDKTLRAEIDSYFHVFFYDIDQEVIKLEDFFSVSSYPTTAIVDKDGIVIQKFTGFEDSDQYMTTLYHIIDKHLSLIHI